MRLVTAAATLTLIAGSLPAQQLPSAIYTDPPQDAAYPARVEVVHIPSGGVGIVGVVYLAAGPGLHPTVILCHGSPGNEKNLDLAQAVRRAGWNVITFNYRGSWGSPGAYRYAHTLEDGDAVVAFAHDSANLRRLGIDTARLVLVGHSLGGWVAAHTASHTPGLRGAILISAADMGARGIKLSHAPDSVPRRVATDLASLAGVTGEQLADELIANGARWSLDRAAPGLARLPLLELTADDAYTTDVNALVAGVRAAGNIHLTTEHVATDHAWSDRRIALEASVIRWLDGVAR